MENGFIKLNEALKIIAQKDAKGHPVPFSIEYRTYNESTKKGGNLKRHEMVKYLPNAITVQNIEGKTVSKSKKNPNHFENRTRNIELQTGEIRTVRIDFIISINNVNVIY